MTTAECSSVDMHPYWYARVIGVFHAHIRFHTERGPSRLARVDFLWVHWFEQDTSYNSGWAARRLPRIRFLPNNDSTAFGFINPADVVRGAHLIPAFAHGLRTALPPSLARPVHPSEDWTYFYVNM